MQRQFDAEGRAGFEMPAIFALVAGKVVGMNDRDIVPGFIVNEVAGRKAADRKDAVADVEHRVGRIVAATVQETVHPPGDAEKRIQTRVGIDSLANGNRRGLVMMHGTFPRIELPQCPIRSLRAVYRDASRSGSLLVSER